MKTMKAVVLEKYGSVADLQLKDVPVPQLKSEELLIKLHYTSINAADLDFINGHPLVRFTGLRSPVYPILGSDCVGEVIDVNNSSSLFKKGEMAWADTSNPGHYGTFAVYVAVPAKSLRHLSSDLDLATAACLPSAGVVAIQNIPMDQTFDSQMTALVNGAGGGIGTIIVQILVSLGIQVTAVDKVEKHSMLQELGVATTLDYRENDYTSTGQTYDWVYDLQCHQPINECLKAVKQDGRFVMLG